METFKKLSIAAFVLMLLCPFGAIAHPMGNFSINHYSKLTLMAKTFGWTTSSILPRSQPFRCFRNFAHGALQPRVDDLAAEWTRQLRLTADGQALTLRLEDSSVKVEPGAGGLSTVRVMLRLKSRWSSRGGTLHFTDPNFPDRIGWKEIVVQATPPLGFPEGNPFSADRSAALTQYPADLLAVAPNVTEASIRIAPASTL